MKKPLTVIIIGLLCFSMLTMLSPQVKAQSDPIFSSAYGGDPGRDEIMFTADDLDYVPVIDVVESSGISVLTVDCQTSTAGDYATDAHKNFEYISQETDGKHFYYTDAAWNVALATEISNRIGGGKGDVVLTFDLTGSMGWVTGDLKVRTKGIIEALPTSLDLAFGVGTHVDYPDYYSSYGYSGLYGESPDYAWQMNLDITTDRSVAKNVIDSMTNYWGADGPQNYVRVLYETQFYSWRSTAKKIVVMFGDAPSHSAPSGLTLTETTGKELLTNAIREFHDETYDAVDAQVKSFSRIWATFRVETYEPTWLELIKWGTGIISLYYGLPAIPSWVPAKFVKAAKVGRAAMELLAIGTIVHCIYEEVKELLEDPSLSPELGVEVLTVHYANRLLSGPLKPYLDEMNNKLNEVLTHFDSLPDEDPQYFDMITKLNAIEDWMRYVQYREKTINYIDLSSDNLVSTAKVGSLVEQYYPQFTALLDAYELGQTVNDFSTAVIIGLVAAKAIGVITAWAGVGIAVIAAAEVYIPTAIGITGAVQTLSYLYKDIQKREAESLVLSRINNVVVSDIISIVLVYSATLELIQDWSQAKLYPAEKMELSLDETTYIVTPTDYFDSVPGALIPIYFDISVDGNVSLTSMSSDSTKMRFALEVTDTSGRETYTIGGNAVDIGPEEDARVTFEMPLADMLKNEEIEKTYRVVGYASLGTSVYQLGSKKFRVVRDTSETVDSFFSSDLSSAVAEDEVFSSTIDVPSGSSHFEVALDYPGSDLDLHIYDELGRHTGIDYLTGITEYQIPSSSYSGHTTNPEWISIDEFLGEQTLTVQVVGVDVVETESFSLSHSISEETMKITPAKTEVTVGRTVYYNITIENFDVVPRTYEPIVSGLDPISHMLSPSAITLEPGESANVSLEVSPYDISSIGNHIFDVTADGVLGKASALLSVLSDNTPPLITVVTPAEDPPQALQDGVTLDALVTDASGVDWVTFSIREPDGTIIDPTFESMSATHVSDDEWQLSFDTTQLPDGYYLFLVNASDTLGNENSTTVQFSIRNWACLELLPASESNKAGRTMPVKFSLRVVEAVDSAQPFVYNEELTILIYEEDHPENILQESTYGDTGRDYRINSEDELYITNFRTIRKKPTTYVVEIYRKDMLIGSFEFNTVK